MKKQIIAFDNKDIEEKELVMTLRLSNTGACHDFETINVAVTMLDV
jgi:hypothetical protein